MLHHGRNLGRRAVLVQDRVGDPHEHHLGLPRPDLRTRTGHRHREQGRPRQHHLESRQDRRIRHHHRVSGTVRQFVLRLDRQGIQLLSFKAFIKDGNL